MEHRHSNNILPLDILPTSGRVLADTPGNVQAYALDVQQGIENQDPTGRASAFASESQHHVGYFPKIGHILSSNDHDDALRRLSHRRSKRETANRRRIEIERPYLLSEKYLSYRARPRQDKGPDGKPVWDNRMEEAFQNVFEIGFMGRTKWNDQKQGGKLNGRNELITKKIFELTGEKRTRKQVSSHIQVLNGILRGIPEWDNLTKEMGPNNVSRLQPRKFFRDAIAQAQRGSASGDSHTAAHGYENDEMGLAYDLGSTSASSGKHHLSGLSFEMWVSLPNQIDNAWHKYTQLQSNHSTSNPVPLENIANWRSAFPDLSILIDSRSSANCCDIILLDVTFKLTPDFPPPKSKLGISLELDFRHPLHNNLPSLSELQEWNCMTHVYQHGRPIKPAVHMHCVKADIGKVKPFFESQWWASIFTKLTEKKRFAEDSRNKAAIEAANETSRNFFHSLTIMQVIEAGPSGIWSEHPKSTKMAILLWKFSQLSPSQSNFVGTATWQKLFPPPDRLTTNSPLPSTQEMGLPSLSMDTIVEDLSPIHGLDGDNDFLAQHSHGISAYTSSGGDELCHDGFNTTYKDDLNTLAAMHGSFDLATPHDPSIQTLADMSQYHFDLQSHDLQFTHPDAHNVSMANVFDPHQQSYQVTDATLIPSTFHGLLGERQSSPDPTARLPLSSFDISTHNNLQVQLSEQAQPRQHRQHQGHSSVAHENNVEAFRAALGAASTMSDLVSHSDHGFPQTAHGLDNEAQQHWTELRLRRPTLQSHVSYNTNLERRLPSYTSPVKRSESLPNANTAVNAAAFDANQMINSFIPSDDTATTQFPKDQDNDKYRQVGDDQSKARQDNLFIEEQQLRQAQSGPSMDSFQDTLGTSFAEMTKDEQSCTSGGSFHDTLGGSFVEIERGEEVCANGRERDAESVVAME